MKNVLIVTTISGFLPQFEKNDVKILKEYGYTVHYASNFKNPVYEFDRDGLIEMGLKLHHIDIQKSPGHFRENIRAFRQLRQVIEKEKIQVLHCHNPMGGVIGRCAAASVKEKPYVLYTAHGFHFYDGAPLKNWLFFYTAERGLAHVTDQIITINQEDNRRARNLPLRTGGVAVQIHGVGVDAGRFCLRPELRAAKRKELGIGEREFHIVTAAELNGNKNQRTVIEAIAELNRTDIRYSICGKGPWEERLKELISHLHLEGQVQVLGYRTDMEEILQTADCFAFPSRREGLGIAAIEALLCGVPLIAADNRGTREYTVPDVNGILCRADDVGAYAKAIERLYTDRPYRADLASGCRASAGPFVTEEVEKTMRSVYRRVDRVLMERKQKWEKNR